VYELGIATYHNKLVWINGPFPAGQNDKKVLDKPNGLKSKIPNGPRATIGDKGYRGDPNKIATRITYDLDEMKKFKKPVKARYKTFNSRLKAFEIHNQAFQSAGHSRLKNTRRHLRPAACLSSINWTMAAFYLKSSY
jgi:hypothetical protein